MDMMATLEALQDKTDQAEGNRVAMETRLLEEFSKNLSALQAQSLKVDALKLLMEKHPQLDGVSDIISVMRKKGKYDRAKYDIQRHASENEIVPTDIDFFDFEHFQTRTVLGKSIQDTLRR